MAAVLIAGVCQVAGACGGDSATAPDARPVPLRPGRQLLTLGGFAGSVDSALPPCTPIGQPKDGTSVNTIVLLRQEGAEWVARSEPATGSLELRLRGVETSSGGYRMGGTAIGSAADVGLMGVVRDVTLTVGPSAGGAAAAVDGDMAAANSSLVVGRVTGALRFSDSRGASSTCGAIQWSMQPYQP